MRSTQGRNENEVIGKTGKIEEACRRYGMGQTTMRKVAEEAHAVIRIGRLYLINFSKVDEYMDSISQ